ncbi:MAG: methylmalonyl-CoA epimerase [Alphaproteobacteria bacterium]|nr:methylmalonyl-CoA epimerase [Alphaproteobacteria bacterium]
MWAKVSGVEDCPDHGVRVVFVELPNTTIELMTPLGEDSPVAKFLMRNPEGGIHHICLEVKNIMEARDRLRAEGVRILGDGEPKTGAHGKPVLFAHPKDLCGTLIEIEEA